MFLCHQSGHPQSLSFNQAVLSKTRKSIAEPAAKRRKRRKKDGNLAFSCAFCAFSRPTLPHPELAFACHRPLDRSHELHLHRANRLHRRRRRLHGQHILSRRHALMAAAPTAHQTAVLGTRKGVLGPSRFRGLKRQGYRHLIAARC